MAIEHSSAGFGMTEAAETHLSMLFFTPDRVLKILKPVDAGFVSFVDRDVRLQAATREYELNHRISPDVYLGTVDLVEDGDATDRVVVMRRLPEDRQLDRLAGQPGFDRRVEESARLIASFHSGLVPVTGSEAWMATADHLRANWQDNFDALRPLGGTVLSSVALNEAESLVDRYLAGRQTLFDERIEDGRIVDGHGDLRAEHVFCMDDGPRVIDCLAFRDDYRIGDVLADVAFLAMDLHRLVGPATAMELVRSYDEFSNEHHPGTLAHHYVAYRAHVRAKVAAVRFSQGDRGAAAEIEAYHALALEHLRVGQVRLVLVGGGAGVGKSTVADGVSEEIGATWLRSDEIRKSLAGLRSDQHQFEKPGRGLYDHEASDAVYEQLLQQAEALLCRGESVVLDATWSSESRRSLARSLAERTSATLTELRCVLPLAEAKERIAKRMASIDNPSDATPEIAQYLAEQFEVWPEAWIVDTRRSIAASISNACQFVTESARSAQVDKTITVDHPGLVHYESVRFFLSRRRAFR